MKSFTKVAMASLLGLAVLSTTAYADVAKGQKLYTKKLKSLCKTSGAKFAASYTQTKVNLLKLLLRHVQAVKRCSKVTSLKINLKAIFMTLFTNMQVTAVTFLHVNHNGLIFNPFTCTSK